MTVEALDHVNIITDRLEESAQFYAELLDLEPRDGPAPLTHETARWLFDRSGQAIVHLNSVDCPRLFDREVEPGGLTGALHHVALRCSGYDAVKARLEERGASFEVNVIDAIGLRQIFTPDPNNVLLELNFFAG
jgi:catechol 2,3-dioxygenase-like lactoylglutathione lyase family enzyme